MRKWIVVTLSVLFILGCAKHIPQEFNYDSNINSVVVVKNQLGGHGTGFYIGDNLIITASHVVPESVTGVVYTSEGMKVLHKVLEFTAETYNKDCYKLEVVYRSLVNDIAFLKIEDGHSLVPAILAGENPKIGDRIYMVSHPSSYKWSYSEGYVVNIPVTMGNDKFAMLSNIARFYGSSGSGVYNEANEVIGLMNALLQDSSIAIGHTVKTIKEDLEVYYGSEKE